MSARKRTTVSRTTAKKKPATKKVASRSRAVTKKTTKKTTKKSVAKKVAKKVVKKTAKKTFKRVVKRVVKRPKNAPPQSVREARFGGHDNTIPDNPNAPGHSVLGRSFALSVLGASTIPLNSDALAIGIARVGGIAIMFIGLLMSWHLFNELAPLETAQVASVIESVPDRESRISVLARTPNHGAVQVVITTPDAETVLLVAESRGTTSSQYIFGTAAQRSAETWEISLDTTALPDDTYTLKAFVSGSTHVAHETITADFPIQNNSLVAPPVTEIRPPTTSTSTATTSVATSTETAPTTTMPTLAAPEVVQLVPGRTTYTTLYGRGTPKQVIEVLLLREQYRATTSVQANGWWTHTMPTPRTTAEYELYAQATEEFLSGPLDFEVIAGRLVRTPPTGDTQVTNIPSSEPNREMLLWYLLAAVTLISVGAVLLLIGHHLHHTRPRPPASLDAAA
jgi:hypothetical protein